MARIAGSLNTLRSQYLKAHPKIAKSRYGWIGDEAHQSRQSDHNPDAKGIVKAMDVPHDPANGLDCNKEAEKVMHDVRVNYVIWNRQIWQRGTWKKYTGSNPHTEHMHISVNANNADVDHEWNIGDNVAETADLNNARQIAYAFWGRDGRDGRPNALNGQTDDDLKKNHVGKLKLNPTNITSAFDSLEGVAYRKKLDAVYAERDQLRAQVAALTKQLQNRPASTQPDPDGEKWRTYKALNKELNA